MKIWFYQIALILIIGFSFKVNGQETQFSIIGNISNYPTDYANEYLTVIDKNLQQLNNLISKFSSGAKAPDFKLNDIDGKIYGLSDFKNKTICIDVWASWCSPCISSYPKWNKLVVKHSKENNFQFISVSIDKDESKWIKSIEISKLIKLEMDNLQKKSLFCYAQCV